MGCKICGGKSYSSDIWAHVLCNSCYHQYQQICFLIDNAEQEHDVIEEFSWLYARYPRFWGFFNVFSEIAFKFAYNPTVISMTVADMEAMWLTSVETDTILRVLKNANILNANPDNPEMFFRGETLDSLVRILQRAPTLSDNDYRKEVTFTFGLISLMLTKSLVDIEITGALHVKDRGKFIPRKALSIFRLFVEHLNKHEDIERIQKRVEYKTYKDSSKKLAKQQKRTILEEMSGLTVASPGIPKIVEDFSMDGGKDLILKPIIVNFLERYREYIRDRDRLR